MVFIHCISMVKMKDAANRKMASFACLQSSPLGAIFWTKNVCTKVICQALVFAASALFLLTGFKLTRLVWQPKLQTSQTNYDNLTSNGGESRGISQQKCPLVYSGLGKFSNLPRFCWFPAILFYISQSCKLFSNCSMEVFGKMPDA